jgi:hypothetical protein
MRVNRKNANVIEPNAFIFKKRKCKFGGFLVAKREIANKSKLKTMQDAIELNKILLENIKTHIKDEKTQKAMTGFFNKNMTELITRGKKLYGFYEKLSESEHMKKLLSGILTTMVEDYFSSISKINTHVIKGDIKGMADMVLLKQIIEKDNNYFQKATVFNLVYECILQIENKQKTVEQLDDIITKNRHLLENN